MKKQCRIKYDASLDAYALQITTATGWEDSYVYMIMPINNHKQFISQTMLFKLDEAVQLGYKFVGVVI